MGGQACVFYGATEFSRDLDLLILAEPQNLDRFRSGLRDLAAEPIAVPPFDSRHLARGHAAHFRCHRKDVAGLRIDVMAVLRGVARFEELWSRRTTIEADGEPIDLLGIKDLVDAKKTQRDNWPMIRRLVEQSYFSSGGDAALDRIEFWLRELRTPELLVRMAETHPSLARDVAPHRPPVEAALRGDIAAVERTLQAEEEEERRRDREYWDPLKTELEGLRRAKH